MRCSINLPAPDNSLPGLAPAYLAAKEKLASGKTLGPLPKRQYGRTKEKLSIIGFGGMVVKDVTPKQAANYVAEAVDRGVNYFDVAPYYGNAQQRLGSALKPYRKNCFLACKTLERNTTRYHAAIRRYLPLAGLFCSIVSGSIGTLSLLIG